MLIITTHILSVYLSMHKYMFNHEKATDTINLKFSIHFGNKHGDPKVGYP